MSQAQAYRDPLRRVQGSGGTGNKSSQDNPLNTINDQDYNNLTAVSQNLANQDPLRRVAQAGSVQTSNVSSGDNPLNPSTYNRPTTNKRQI